MHTWRLCRLSIGIGGRAAGHAFPGRAWERETGSRPFPSNDHQELIYSHIAKNPPFPSEINSEIPEVLSLIILKLLKKIPEERYQSPQATSQNMGMGSIITEKIGHPSYLLKSS